MNSPKKKTAAVVCTVTAVILFAQVTAYRLPLTKGCAGTEVMMLQMQLKELGYFKYPEITGYFGDVTRNAVIHFQHECNIQVDGIAGPQTERALKQELQLQARTQKAVNDLPVSRTSAAVRMLTWPQADALFERKTGAVVVDLLTGKRFSIYRLGGDLHADVEPLTKKDSAVMKSVYGNRWSWTRRAVLVELDGMRIPASMNGMPHGVQDIYKNTFDGHFCIHFYGSRVHHSGKADPEHQLMVRKAASAGRQG